MKRDERIEKIKEKEGKAEEEEEGVEGGALEFFFYIPYIVW